MDETTKECHQDAKLPVDGADTRVDVGIRGRTPRDVEIIGGLSSDFGEGFVEAVLGTIDVGPVEADGETCCET